MSKFACVEKNEDILETWIWIKLQIIDYFGKLQAHCLLKKIFQKASKTNSSQMTVKERSIIKDNKNTKKQFKNIKDRKFIYWYKYKYIFYT